MNGNLLTANESRGWMVVDVNGERTLHTWGRLSRFQRRVAEKMLNPEFAAAYLEAERELDAEKGMNDGE